MSHNGDKKLSPYEELVDSLGFYSDSAPTNALLKFLKILDFKAQVAFDRTVANQKILTSLDEELFLNIEENEGLRDKLTKEFYNKTNFDNAIESSPQYQQAQGLNTKRPDMEEDADMWKTEIIFEDPYDQANFDDAVGLLQTINPEVSTYKLFKVLTDN